MPRTRKEMASHARAVARVVDTVDEPLRSEEIRSRLHDAGHHLTIKQTRRTLELAEKLGLVGRVNRSRWGAAGAVPPPSLARRSRAAAVIDAASRLLELPASTDLNRALRAVLRLATGQADGPVLSQQTPAFAASATGTPSTSTPKGNGANDAADKIEVRFDPHS